MNKLLRFLLCVSILCNSLFAQAQVPVANFSSNIQSSCAPALIQFTDLSTGNPTSWRWDLGNGTIALNQNPSTTYLIPGTYTVILTATNANGANTKTVVNYITINPPPTVAFYSPDTVMSCAPKTVQFTNQSVPNSGGTTTYFWDFGDGSTSNAQNPSHTYTASGNFTVSLVVTNGSGCTNVLNKSQYVKIAPKPASGFTASNNNSCTAPITTTFTNTTTNATTYRWFFGDGGTSTATNPTHTYTAPGSYTVTLISQNGGGCPDTLVTTAAVNIGNLSAGFTNAATACAGSGVVFTNTTVPGAGNSTWYFGDGGTSTVANPTHTYTNPGTYTVKLVVNYSNCSDSVTHNITVNPKPTAAFSANKTVGCSVPLTVNFTNASSGGVSYLWDFGDGGTSTATNPSHTYTALGNYTVKLIATGANGCTDTLVKTDYIKLNNVVISLGISPVAGCAPVTTVFTGTIVSTPEPIATYLWDFGDGTTSPLQNPSHTYNTPGSYTVTYTVTTVSGCTASGYHVLNYGNRPVSNFTYTPGTVCSGSGSVQFTNTSTNGTTYLWFFGDGATSTATNPSHVYDVPGGTYTVTLITYNNGCSDTMVKTNIIRVLDPFANFTTAPSCANRKTTLFTNLSVGATSYSWNFGDGSPTSTATNPTHTYASNGTYSVTLTATNSTTGCVSMRTYPVRIFDITPAFTADTTKICRGQAVTFTSTSTGFNQYTWNFGDGITQTTSVNTVTHTYGQPGIYTVSLSLTDNVCTDSVRKVNYISVGGSDVNFTGTPQNGCSPLPVNFVDISNSALAIATRTWNFGDGVTQNAPGTNIAHTYTNRGSYNVTLTLTDILGCTATVTKPAYINVTKPQPDFYTTDTNSCAGSGVFFINNTVAIGPTISFFWDFGDGTFLTTPARNVSHTYAAAGTYSVKLVVTDVNGCKDSLTRPAYIRIINPTAGFTMSDSTTFCPPLSVVFTNTSLNAVSYLWDFGNGNTSTSPNPTNIFTAPGIFTVTLKAYNASGCVDSFRRTVRIQQGPTGTFTYSPTSGCLPITVTFTATNTNTTSVTWDFSNGVTQTTTGNSTTYTYTQPGVFIPKVIFSNNNGCSTSVVGADSIKINKVFAGFSATPNPVCVGIPVQFTDTSRTVTASVTTYSWNFGDNTTATTANPTHSYATAGTYTVRLIATAPGGCADSAFRTVVVNPLPVVAVASQAFCAGGSVVLNATGANTYSWTPATGLSCTNCASPTANPTATTTYTITGTSLAGCNGTTTATVTVNPRPAVSAGANVSVCTGNSTPLQATGATTYVWTPATGLSCTNCANPTASPTATTTYTVTGTDANGCTNTAQVTVTIVTVPSVTVTPDQSICAGASASLQASGAASYTWTPATGLSCTNCANPTATPTTTTTYTVTGAAGSNGCSATAQTTVTVNPRPVISAGNSRSICAGDTTTLTATGGSTYSWSPATGLSCTSCASPVASPTTTTTYTVTGTGANGCTNTATVTITVNPVPNVSAGANQSICNGNSVTLQATGATSYSWTPTTGLSCTTCASPTASPTVTTTYIVTGTNASGCRDTAHVTVTVGTLPSVSGGPNQFICPGGSVTLQGSGATTYVWTPATGLSCTSCTSPTASPAATTTYTVTGTGANGCTGTAQVTVTVNATPSVTVTGNNPVCAGGSVALTATGANSYSWTPATGLSCTNCANPTATPTTTTTYTVTGTSGVGCTATTQVTVTVNPRPTVSAGAAQTICQGLSANLTATGAATYVWTPATGLSCTNCASPTATPATTTTYTVKGTSASGCTDSAQVTVTVNPRPTITTSNQSICPGGSASLSATGGTSYVWTPATGLSCTNCANPTATPATTTTYTVTGTGANGCTNTAQAIVTVNPVPVVVISGNNSTCLGTGTALTASGANTYTWTPATGLSCTNCASPTATPAATTTYTITGTSGAGCTSSTQFTVTVHALPVVTASGDVETCAGTAVNLRGFGATSYSWTPATGLSCTNCTTTSATPASTTTYVVTGTDAFGCKDTGMVTVTVKPLPVVFAGNDTSVCQLMSAQLNATGADTYTWSPATTLSCANCNNPVASPTATTTYTVTGTGTNGCINTDNVTVSLYAQPAVNAGPDQTICFGQGAQLQASGASTYTWSPATTLTCANCTSPLANPPANAIYQVIGTDVHGCRDSDQVAITVIQRGPVSIGPGGDICAGASFSLSATGGTAYTWIPSAGLSAANISNPVATPATTTIYRVVIQQGQCFNDTLSATVTVHPIPTVDAGPDRNVVAGSPTPLQTTTTNVQSYRWSPADGLSCTTCAVPDAKPERTTTYTVRVTSEFGCEAQDDVTLFVTCDASQLWLPNTFTPNGDGQNDRFYPHGKGITSVSRFRIYDRWGELIYDATNMPVNDMSYGWDGTYKNRQLKPDVYVYIINAQCSTGEPLEIKGDISLIR